MKRRTNRLPILAIAFAICCFIVPVALTGHAQSVPEILESYSIERDKLEQKVQTRFDAVVAAAETEIQAGRISKETVPLVRRQLEDMRRELPILNSFTMKPSTGEGEPNPGLNKAKREFSAAVEAREAFRKEKPAQVREQIVQWALEIWWKVNREEDLKEPIELVRKAEKSLSQEANTAPPPVRSRFGFPQTGMASASVVSSLNEILELLSWSQRFFVALNGDNPDQLTRVVAQAGGNGPYPWLRVVGQTELERWRSRFTDQVKAELDVIKGQIENLVANNADSQTLQPAVEKLDLTIRRLEALGGRSEITTANGRSAGEALRAWVRTLQRIEGGDWQNVQRELDAAGGPPSWWGDAARKGFYAKLKGADAGRSAAEKLARSEFDKQIRERLTKVTDAASALALADELSVETRSSASGSESSRERLSSLQADVRRLAAAWNSQGNFGYLQNLATEMGSSHPWQAELRNLRSKIIREHLAQKTNSPELLAAPLDALPLESAIRKLGRARKEKQDWLQLHELLASAYIGQDGRESIQGDELRGVKAFLTGQNFEKAEQYRDAVQSYKQVMSCIGELVPVEAAAERLKALAREHPDLNSPPSGAGL